MLDIAYREDECRVRTDHVPHNFAIRHHIALNLLKQERLATLAVKNKCLGAGWDHDYLLKLLAQYDAFALRVLLFAENLNSN